MNPILFLYDGLYLKYIRCFVVGQDNLASWSVLLSKNPHVSLGQNELQYALAIPVQMFIMIHDGYVNPSLTSLHPGLIMAGVV